MEESFNYIVLDIDGVLNNYESRKHKEIANFHSKIFNYEDFIKDDFNFDPKCLDALNSLISSLENPKIVISSDWRYHTSSRNFHDMFNVVGVRYTPIDLIEGIQDNNNPNATRAALILNYIKQHNDVHSWCAIDDRKDLYPDDFEPVVFTDPHKGLTEEDVKKFLEKVSHEIQSNLPKDI